MATDTNSKVREHSLQEWQRQNAYEERQLREENQQDERLRGILTDLTGREREARQALTGRNSWERLEGRVVKMVTVLHSNGDLPTRILVGILVLLLLSWVAYHSGELHARESFCARMGGEANSLCNHSL